MVRPSIADARPLPTGTAASRVGVIGLLLLVGASGCGGKAAEGAAGRTPHDAKDVAARLDRMMARENGPFSKHKLELLGGLAVGEIESQSAPKTECKKDNDGSLVCALEVDLGKDADGDANNIVCAVSTKLEAFGPGLKDLLRDSGLQETPAIEVKPLGEGIVASFTANFSHESETTVTVGTMKTATLYAHGFMAACFDRQTGGRKTFARISEGFFESLKFKDRPEQPAVFAYGYRERSGERTTGFRYGFIARDTESEPRYFELGTFFTLNTDGKTWNVIDAGVETVRDKKGLVESMRELVWADGKGPAVLSAKPSEGGKFRLKFEAGAKSDALEATPQATLTSELWSAPELAKLATGATSKYRYAVIDMSDGDPTFRYVTLTRSKPGVLLEELEAGKHAKPAADGEVKNKLEVDARGLVTKQVSASSVMELVYTWGQLPSLNARPGGGTKGKSAP